MERRLVVLVAGLLAWSAAACGGDEPVRQVRIQLVSVDNDLAFPSRVEDEMNAVAITAFRGADILWTRTERYTGNPASLKLPKLPFGEDIQLIVEARRGNTTLASGATPRLSLTSSSPLSIVNLPILEQGVFTRGFFAEDEFDRQPLRLGVARAAATMTPVHGGAAYVVVGGAAASGASAGLGGTPFSAAVDVVEMHDAEFGDMVPIYEGPDCGAREPLRLFTPRIFHTTTALPDGRLVIAGGFAVRGGQWEATDSVEVLTFDSRDRFCATLVELEEGLFRPRAFHTATLMADASRPANRTRLLFVGGAGGRLTADGASLTPDSVRRVEEIRIPVRANAGLEVEETDLNLTFPRFLHSAHFVPERQLGVILVGGLSRSGNALTFEERVLSLYEDTGDWTLIDEGAFEEPSGDVRVRRYGHGSQLFRPLIGARPGALPTLVVAGGFSGFGEGGTLFAAGQTAATVDTIGVFLDAGFEIEFLERVDLPEAHRSGFGALLPLSLAGGFLYAGGIGADGGVRREAATLAVSRNGEVEIEAIGGGLGQPRAFMSAMELSSFLHLIVGGWSGTAALADTEYYNGAAYQNRRLVP